ncbi:MAG: hypothetical protein RLZZ15_926 [Verrucomicrobiota bacterium]
MTKLGRGAAAADVQRVFPEILRGGDPLGEFFLASVSPADRRAQGATFTPAWLVDLQLDQIATKGAPARVVDAGAGSGRYALAAARRWPKATVVAVEKDPALAEAIRINAHAAGLCVHVVCEDYLAFTLPQIAGVTAFVGNPPYVRHHDISVKDKAWYSDRMRRLDLPHSQLAGLHLYFYLQSFLLSQPGDCGCFVTAAEWLETNYGEGMRALFCNMGGDGLVRVDPAEQLFSDALTTSVIATWGRAATDRVEISDLVERTPQTQFHTPREELRALAKWPGYGQPLPPPAAAGPVLGDFFRVSRGQVTGLNEIWIANTETEKLIPTRYLFPCVTDAAEIIDAGGVLRDATALRRVIDLPADLGELSAAERGKVDAFLERATRAGAERSYVAQHRRPWWRVRLPAPAPIVMSYMGRRPPRFARNACGARLINVAHGLTPLHPITISAQDRLVAWLNHNVAVTGGRTYGGGLVKFEPGDAMNIPLPDGAATFSAA